MTHNNNSNNNNYNNKEKIPAGTEMEQHQFSPAGLLRVDHGAIVTWCNLCEQLVLWGVQSALECNVCGLVVHDTCRDTGDGSAPGTAVLTDFPCRPPVTTASAYKQVGEPPSKKRRHASSAAAAAAQGALVATGEATTAPGLSHHLVPHNIHAGARCGICEGDFDLLAGTGVRCSRCFESAHDNSPTSPCLQAFMAENCRPPFLKMLLPPPAGIAASTHPEPRPLLAFVNGRSGGRAGEELLRQLPRLLDPGQVFDMNREGGPQAVLEKFVSTPGLCLLACGGDGTVGWLLSALDALKLPPLANRPPVAVLPLGTGNDLARTLGWGGGYEGANIADLEDALDNVEKSEIVGLDRWQLDITDADGVKTRTEVLNNYTSFGVDAQMTLDFHTLRESSPGLFPTQMVNKLWYANFGLKNVFTGVSFIEKMIKDGAIFVDDEEILLPENTGGLIFLNIPSYAGGADIWGPIDDAEQKSRDEQRASHGLGARNPLFSAPSVGDGLLEVSTVSGTIELGLNQMSLLHGTRLAQGRRISFTLLEELPMQVDGEPWLQAPGTFDISHLNTVPMMKRSGFSFADSGADSDDSAARSGEVGNSMSKKQLLQENARLREQVSSLSQRNAELEQEVVGLRR